jgi:hypothetical protein
MGMNRVDRTDVSCDTPECKAISSYPSGDKSNVVGWGVLSVRISGTPGVEGEKRFVLCPVHVRAILGMALEGLEPTANQGSTPE